MEALKNVPRINLNKCKVCGQDISKNNSGQVVKYCSKECRLNRNKPNQR